MNQWNLNWGQFKNLVCYQCQVGSVILPISLNQEVESSNNTFYTKLSFNENLLSCLLYTTCKCFSHTGTNRMWN